VPFDAGLRKAGWRSGAVLGVALDAVQNGSMFTDMSKSSELAAVSAKLADLAQAIAEKAGDLSGEAAKAALDSAVSLGNKAAEMASASALGTAPPPLTQTEKGAALNQLGKIQSNPTPLSQTQPAHPIDQAQAEIMGTTLQPTGTGGGASTGSGGGTSSSGSTGGIGSTGGGGPATPGGTTNPGNGTSTPSAVTSFELLVRLFISCAVVRFDPEYIVPTVGQLFSYTPANWLIDQTSVGVKGDNRGFGYAASSFRAELVCQLSFVDGTDEAPMIRTTAPSSHRVGNQVAGFHLNFGDTEEYDHADTLPVAGQPWWYGNLVNGAQPLYPPTRLASTPNNAGFKAQRSGNFIRANLGLNAPIPASSTLLQLSAPDITADLEFGFKMNPGNSLTVTVSGSHDHFLSYEVYVDGNAVYQKAADAMIGPVGLMTVGSGAMRSGHQPQVITGVQL
jgi:hypothetical protein